MKYTTTLAGSRRPESLQNLYGFWTNVREVLRNNRDFNTIIGLFKESKVDFTMPRLDPLCPPFSHMAPGCPSSDSTLI